MRPRGRGHCRPHLAAPGAPVPAPPRASFRVHLLPGSAGGGQSWHTGAIPRRTPIWTASPARLCFIQGGLGERPPSICWDPWARAHEESPGPEPVRGPLQALALQPGRPHFAASGQLCLAARVSLGAYITAEIQAVLSRLVCSLVSCMFSPSGRSFSLFGCLQLGLENTTLEGPQSGVPKLRPAVSPPRAEPTATLSWPAPGLTRGHMVLPTVPSGAAPGLTWGHAVLPTAPSRPALRLTRGHAVLPTAPSGAALGLTWGPRGPAFQGCDWGLRGRRARGHRRCDTGRGLAGRRSGGQAGGTAWGCGGDQWGVTSGESWRAEPLGEEEEGLGGGGVWGPPRPQVATGGAEHP